MAALEQHLPRPIQTLEYEQTVSRHATRVVDSKIASTSSLVLKGTDAPPYGQRGSWRPKQAGDYCDGGAYPEIPVVQYPHQMGLKTSESSDALSLQVDSHGKIKYDALAQLGHDGKRVVQASFKDLIPLRQQALNGEISLSRPDMEEVASQTERTRSALASLVSASALSRDPKNVNGLKRSEATYVRYTPASQMGHQSINQDRIMKIVSKQEDPMEPPKFKFKKIPRGPPSPPAPVMHSPPRKLTAEDQEAFRIPPPISNWKNPKGYTVPLDKRLAADGRGLQDVTINDKFAQFAEALFTADRHAREDVKQRHLMQQKLAEKEKLQKEETLRGLARQAREGTSRRRIEANSTSRSVSRESSIDRHSEEDEIDSVANARSDIRRERREEHLKQLKQSRMGTERKMQLYASKQNRDISEKVALGIAKPTQTSQSMWDSRLFNQTSGFSVGFNEDQAYDKPLFAAQEALNTIYKPTTNIADDDQSANAQQFESMQKQSRFEVLGQPNRGFEGATESEPREGPVKFVSETQADPFQIDAMIEAAAAATPPSSKRPGSDTNKVSKRSKIGL